MNEMTQSLSIAPKNYNHLKPVASYYKDKTVIVTGASSGIGQSTSLLLGALGANVIMMARTQADLDKTVSMLEAVRQGPGQRFQTFVIDLRDSKAVVSLLEKLLAENSVDILVNNAGVYFTNYFQEQSPEQIESMVLTNMLAPLLLTRCVIPHFLKRGGGQIVNVSSLAAKLNFTGYGVYGGTKAGLSHSSKGLQFEYEPKNIFFSDYFAPDSLTRGYEEELKMMPAETKKINGTVVAMKPIDVAVGLLIGVSKRQLEIVPGAKSKAISFLAKHLSPSSIQSILRLLSK